MRFLFVYPSRGRPKQFKETLSLWQKKLSGNHQYRWIINIDTDDPDMCGDAMTMWLNARENLLGDSFKVYRGLNKSKIEACNANLPTLRGSPDDYDIAILVSDDMIPVAGSYDDIIAEQMQKLFPKLDGCLHYDDGFCQHQNCIVLSIIGRELMEMVGNRFYWNEYHSLWCDTEFTQVVYREKRACYIPRTIIQHAWKQNGMDPTYAKSDADFGRDKEIFVRRQREGFPGAIKVASTVTP